MVSPLEKLGAFYLGREYDQAARKPHDRPIMYDARDLTTHGVCVGMTGSGKTGLCVDLLEEAALDGVPAIIIDPKGDITNLLLMFPELRPVDFEPWINLDDARRHGYPPGQQRAFVMAKVLEQNSVVIVGAEDPDLVRSAKFLTAPTVEAAFAMASAKLGDGLDLLVVPHALLTLPIVQTTR